MTEVPAWALLLIAAALVPALAANVAALRRWPADVLWAESVITLTASIVCLAATAATHNLYFFLGDGAVRVIAKLAPPQIALTRARRPRRP